MVKVKSGLKKITTFAHVLENIMKAEGDEFEWEIFERRRFRTLHEPLSNDEQLEEMMADFEDVQLTNRMPHRIPSYGTSFYDAFFELITKHYGLSIAMNQELTIHWDDEAFQEMLNEFGVGYVDAFYTFKGLSFIFKRNHILVEWEKENLEVMEKKVRFLS